MNTTLNLATAASGTDHKHRVRSFGADQEGIDMSADMILKVVDLGGQTTEWYVHQHEKRPPTALYGANQTDWYLKPTDATLERFPKLEGWRFVTETQEK
jgi:hypothetical protein